MKTVKILLAISLCFVSCSKKTEKKDEQKFDSITGHWSVFAYYTSGNYFTQTDDGDYYDFDGNGNCSYYSGDLLDTYDEYEYTFNKETQTITCIHDRGWNLSISVEYLDKNEAIFHITGKTSSSSKTVKVRRD